MLVAGIVSLIAFFGDARLSALTSSERSAVAAPDDTKKININGAVPLFDDDRVHEIEFTFDPADYTRMIATYQSQGVKDFIEATVTLDGTTIQSVGIRL